MTCGEYRATVPNDLEALQWPREMRRQYEQHYLSCPGCREWTNRMELLNPNPPEIADEIEGRITAMRFRDALEEP